MCKNIVILVLSVLSLLLAMYVGSVQCRYNQLAETNAAEKLVVNDSLPIANKAIDSSFMYQDTVSITDTTYDDEKKKKRVIVHSYHSNGMIALARVHDGKNEPLVYYDSHGQVSATRMDVLENGTMIWLCLSSELFRKSQENFKLYDKSGPSDVYDLAAFASFFMYTKSPFACDN